jgi:catalase
MADPPLEEQIEEAMVEPSGRHPGHRTVHTKGLWCEGTFTATPEAASLCRAAFFSGDPVAALIRFSNAAGNPQSNDGARQARGMAVKLRPEGADETDILATTSPAFVSRTPEDFLELLHARKPDPDTGEPDMERLGAYLGAHPEAQTAIQATLGAEPPASFATIAYWSPHTFRLLDRDGGGTWVRYRWRPEAGEERISDEAAKERGRDYLASELAERLAAGPAAFELLLQLPAEDDPIDDPTAVWPDDRELVSAGRLEVERVIESPERDGHIDVFDPMRLGDGIEPSDDPILHIRPKAYSVSAYRRWDRG